MSYEHKFVYRPKYLKTSFMSNTLGFSHFSDNNARTLETVTQCFLKDILFIHLHRHSAPKNCQSKLFFLLLCPRSYLA